MMTQNLGKNNMKEKVNRRTSKYLDDLKISEPLTKQKIEKKKLKKLRKLKKEKLKCSDTTRFALDKSMF